LDLNRQRQVKQEQVEDESVLTRSDLGDPREADVTVKQNNK
jgi:hypothetical protein